VFCAAGKAFWVCVNDAFMRAEYFLFLTVKAVGSQTTNLLNQGTNMFQTPANDLTADGRYV